MKVLQNDQRTSSRAKWVIESDSKNHGDPVNHGDLFRLKNENMTHVARTDVYLDAYVETDGAITLPIEAQLIHGKTRLPNTETTLWSAEHTKIDLNHMSDPVIGPLINASRALAAATQCTIGIGPQVSGGVISAGSLGVGICVDKHGRLGFYGSAGEVVGQILSISVTWQVTVIFGDIYLFTGNAFVVGVGVGTTPLPLDGNASLIFTRNSAVPIGVSAGFGLGERMNFEWFGGFQQTAVPRIP